MAFSSTKLDWKAADGVTADALNRIEGNVQALYDASAITVRALVGNDFLNIDTTGNMNSDNMKSSIFGSNAPATDYTNSPYTAGPFYGNRTVTKSKHLITVTLEEAYPVPGRVWSRTYDTSASTWSTDWLANGKSAPENHAVAAGTYGVGNGELYGHVKLSDSASWASTVAGGFAATPRAVKTANDAAAAANTNANNRMPIGGGVFTGNVFAGARILAAPAFEHVYNTCIQTAGGAANVSSRLILMYRK